MEDLKIFTLRINNSHKNILLYKDASQSWLYQCKKPLTIIDADPYISIAKQLDQYYLSLNDCDLLPCFHTDPLRFKLANIMNQSIYTDSDIIIKGDIVAEVKQILANNPNINFIGMPHLFYAKRFSPMILKALQFYNDPAAMQKRCNDAEAYKYAYNHLTADERKNVKIGWETDYIHYSGTNLISSSHIHFIYITDFIYDLSSAKNKSAFNAMPKDLDTIFVFNTNQGFRRQEIDNGHNPNWTNHVSSWSQTLFMEPANDIPKLREYFKNICNLHNTEYSESVLTMEQCLKTKYSNQFIKLFGNLNSLRAAFKRRPNVLI